MRQQLLANFSKPVGIAEIELMLKRADISAPQISILDQELALQYLPLLEPPQGPARSALTILAAVLVTTALGLAAVIVDNAGYLLSLVSAIVLAVTLLRRQPASPATLVRVVVDDLDVGAARAALARFNLVAMLGPVPD